MTDRKKPGVAFWVTVVAVAVLIGYPLSFGPACWLSSHTGIGAPLVPTVYRPLIRTFGEPGSGQPMSRIGQILFSYSELCAAKGWFWACTDTSEGWKWNSQHFF